MLIKEREDKREGKQNHQQKHSESVETGIQFEREWPPFDQIPEEEERSHQHETALHTSRELSYKYDSDEEEAMESENRVVESSKELGAVV